MTGEAVDSVMTALSEACGGDTRVMVRSDQYECPDCVVEECIESEQQEHCTRRLIARTRLHTA